VPSFDAGEAPRRSTSSLDNTVPSRALFQAEGVPTEVVSDTLLLGEARRCEIRVPSELAHRARWLMSQAQFTDAELTFLATGKLEDPENADP
jgi:hypothetical protein